MCEFCKQHGEGKKWYLNIESYLEERLHDEHRKFTHDLYQNMERGAAEGWAAADAPDNRDDVVRYMIDTILKTTHWGQVVPLEDMDKIFDMSINLVRIPCACRITLHGVQEHRSCYHAVASPSQFWKNMFDQWPDVSREMDIVTSEEAKKDFRRFDQEGLIHSVWSFGTPFIGALCNCTPMDCLSMRSMPYGGVRPFFKAEYVGLIEPQKCTGCRSCLMFCHFGAINYSSAAEKCTINQRECFGCGLCRAACPQDAITLLDRNAIPALAEEW
jgi:Pyruvate/2-oxoacid:ferredoxin oxidoreductase delta subunit